VRDNVDSVVIIGHCVGVGGSADWINPRDVHHTGRVVRILLPSLGQKEVSIGTQTRGGVVLYM